MEKGEIYLAKVEMIPSQQTVKPVLVINNNNMCVPLTTIKSKDREALNINFESPYLLCVQNGFLFKLNSENIIEKMGELIED